MNIRDTDQYLDAQAEAAALESDLRAEIAAAYAGAVLDCDYCGEAVTVEDDGCCGRCDAELAMRAEEARAEAEAEIYRDRCEMEAARWLYEKEDRF